MERGFLHLNDVVRHRFSGGAAIDRFISHVQPYA